jgi:hypothetical protein
VLTAPTTSSNWNADPTSTWQLTDTRMTTLETGQAGEGPEIIKLNEGDPNNTSGDGYVFLVDNYSAGGYRAFLTTGAEIASSRQSDRLSQRSSWNVRPAGGLPASPRHGAFVSVPQTVLTAMHDWTSIEAVSSTTALQVDGGRATATVTAADDGDVAGTVTFTGGDWSATVPLAGGRAAVDIPTEVTAVTATYDGYRDGLVTTSASAEVPVSTLTVTTTSSLRCVLGKAQVVVTVHNTAAVAASVTVTTPYGAKTLSLAAGASASTSFTTRLAAVPAGTITVKATGPEGQTFTGSAPIAAGTCN